MKQARAEQGVVRPSSESLDDLMECASQSLHQTRYFEAERLCVDAFRIARRDADFERASRIVMPLLEARRQKRQIAVDAAGDRGVVMVQRVDALAGEIVPGCYLICPPAIGLEARMFRERADAQEIPVFVLAREPMTRAGLIPVVGVGKISVRTQVEPPKGSGNDLSSLDAADPEVLQWFERSVETLGDSAIASVPTEDPAQWQVDDLIDRLEAVPDHEKLHQRLAAVCRQAAVEPAPAHERRRPLVDDPFSF